RDSGVENNGASRILDWELDVGRWTLGVEKCFRKTPNAQRPTLNVEPGKHESPAKRGLPRPVIDIFMLELGCELGGEVVHLHDDPANAGDEKVVTEHCWNGDTQRRNGRNQCA